MDNFKLKDIRVFKSGFAVKDVAPTHEREIIIDFENGFHASIMLQVGDAPGVVIGKLRALATAIYSNEKALEQELTLEQWIKKNTPYGDIDALSKSELVHLLSEREITQKKSEK